MLRINTKSGKTYRFDLEDDEQAEELTRLLSSSEFQKDITAVAMMKRYTRRHRCDKCKKTAKLICPSCGEIHDDGEFEYMGNQFTVSKPDKFDNVWFEVEKSMVDDTSGGEKLTCFAGDIQLVIMSYVQQPTSRINLTKIGKRRYIPSR